MQTLRQQRRAEISFQRRMEEAKRREALGAPMDRELAARMTRPKVADTLYQVFVDIRGEDGSRPASPKFAGRVGEEACGAVLEAINAKICRGELKGWGNARIEAAVHVPIN